MNDAKESVSSGAAQMQNATEKMAQATRSSVQQMIDAFKSFSQQHSQTMREAAQSSSESAGKMAESMSNAVNNMKGGLGGLGEALGFVSKHFVALAALAAGTGIFKEGISESKKFTGEALGLAKSLGIAASEAGVLNLALGDVYVTSEEYSEMSRGLTRQLKLNEEAINKMGLETRDANGHFRNQYEIMKDAGALLEEYKEGTDRNLAAQVIFGRGVSDAGKVIKAAGADMDAARAKAESLGLMLSQQNVNDMKAYKAAMNDLDDALMAIKKAVGDAVMPVFTELSNWMASVGPAAVTITKGAFGGLAATFWYVRNGVVVLWETINAMVISVAEPIRALAVAIAKAMDGDWSGAKAEIAGVADNIKGAWTRAMDEIVTSSEKTNAKVAALFMQGDPTKKSKSGDKDFVNPKEKEDKVKEPKLMRGFEAELAEMKVNFQEQQRLEGSFREFSKQQELEFWESKLTTVTKGSEDEKAIRLKVAQAKLDIDKKAFEVEMANLKNQMAEYKNNTDAKMELAQQYANKMRQAYGEDSTQYAESQRQIIQIKKQAEEQKKQIDAEQFKLRDAYLTDEIEKEREASQLSTQLGMQTKEQELAQERQFEDRLYEIKREALTQKLLLAQQDPDKNPVELARIQAEIEQLTIQHNQRIRKIDQQTTLEQAKDWKTMMTSIQSSMATVIKGVLSGTMAMTQAIRSMFNAVMDAVFNMIASIVARWIMAKITEMIWGKTAAASGVASNAAVGAAAAMASVAAIPFYGWAMAPEVGAEHFSLAMSYGASIASAEGGYDIPAGVNPLVQAHASEMILPAKYADVIRGMADGGSAAGGGGSAAGGGGGALSVSVTAMDSRDVVRSLSRGGALSKALTKAHRNFQKV